MYFIGLNSGTSMDAVDAALVSIHKEHAELISFDAFALPAEIQQQLLQFDQTATVADICALDVSLGQLFAEAALTLIANNGLTVEQITAIGHHGQTVYHETTGESRYTLQIADPNIIAYRTGIQTIADFRRMDMAAGGQGAPLVPLFHVWQFAHAKIYRVILNIGGIANISILPCEDTQPVTGFDTGPGNALLDAWCARHLGQAYDNYGQWAASGEAHANLLDKLLNDPYFSANIPKSTGKDTFNLAWLETALYDFPDLETADVQATLLMLTARSIQQAILTHAAGCQEIIVCGGGAHNTQLMQTLATLLGKRVVTSTEAYGLPADSIEAMAFAWLAHRRWAELPSNLTNVTGAKSAVLLGNIYRAY